MLKYLLLCLLASQGISGRPTRSLPADLASHILIVTPQAQVHLEPALKYEAIAPATFIQHLSPLARIGLPHEETVVYVPSDAAAVSVARSSAPLIAEQAQQQQQSRIETKQYEQISQQIEQIQSAIQQGSSALGPQLSEAASAAAAAASNAGTGFFPSLFPPSNVQKEDKLKVDKIEYEMLLPNSVEARRFYALTPAVSHVIDFVHAPVFVGPLSAIRARSIQPDIKDSVVESASPQGEPVAEISQPQQLKADLIPSEQPLQKETANKPAQLEKQLLDKEAQLPLEQKKLLEATAPLEPQLDENLKKESVKAAEPDQPQKLQQADRAAAGRIDVSDVAVVASHHHQSQEPQQQQAVGVIVDQPVVPVFVPQAKTV